MFDEIVTFTKCSRGCSTYWTHPYTTCPRCQVHERHAEEQTFFSRALIESRIVAIDHYRGSALAMVVRPESGADPIFIRVHDPDHLLATQDRTKVDKLIADLTKATTENTELLAENARLRRRLEKKT